MKYGNEIEWSWLPCALMVGAAVAMIVTASVCGIVYFVIHGFGV
jgi:hypothetical protein